jgi:hypothetical protein
MLHEVMVVPRKSFVRLPEMTVIERPDWVQLITPSFKDGGLNEVSFSAIPDDQADAVIDATIAQYRKLGLKFRWSVGPGSQPDDLAERLERRGLKPSETCGMWRETTGSAPSAAVEEVTAATLGLFNQVMSEGWGVSTEALARYNAAALAEPSKRNRLYLARVEGQPAGVAGCTLFERSVYLQGAVVLPAFRQRGLYAALTATRLHAAAEHGLRLATTQARAETSAPLLERMGFHTACRFPIFVGE